MGYALTTREKLSLQSFWTNEAINKCISYFTTNILGILKVDIGRETWIELYGSVFKTPGFISSSFSVLLYKI